MRSEFEIFMEKENQAWEISRRTPERLSCLVSPSGSLDSIIAHHLHQPSFTTDTQSGGDTADYSNGCIAMVMGNAFRQGESLLFDHLHRRSAKSEGLEQYPQCVISAHEEFTRQLMASSAAKVEIIYGRIVQRRILQTMTCYILPLWGRFSKILLVLVHESNFNNAEKAFMYRRVMLFATHPQRMFYEQKGSSVAVRQDLTFEAASYITDLKVSVDIEYYQSKRWYSKVPTVYQRAQMKAKDLTQKLSLQDVETVFEDHGTEIKAIVKKLTPQDGEWHSYLDDYPHSNNVTRKLIPAAVEATALAIESDCEVWQNPSQFPPAVLEWFKGQKDVLFYYGPVSSMRDIEFAFKKCVDVKGLKKQEEDSRPLRYMLQQLMLKQQSHLILRASANDDLLFNRVDGSKVETVCPCGTFRTFDENPRFACARTGGYVMRQTRRCKSQQCTEKNPNRKSPPEVHLKPVSSDLEGVVDVRLSLRVEKGRNRLQLHRALLRQNDEGPPRPIMIKLWCCRCKEKTKICGSHANREGNLYIDHDAQWTYGNFRPLYLARESRCLNCAGGRLVPLDPDIPFIDQRALAKFQVDFGKYDMVIKAAMLDNWPSQSVKARAYK